MTVLQLFQVLLLHGRVAGRRKSGRGAQRELVEGSSCIGREGAAIGEALVFSWRMVGFGESTVGNSHPLILI